jgi:hypothetical protein
MVAVRWAALARPLQCTYSFLCRDILPSGALTAPDSLESLSLIEELWDTANDGVASSVRCVTAAITAFIITPPVSVFEKFSPPGVRFIGRETQGSDFISRRLRMGKNWKDNDSTRLKILCTS